MKKIQFERQQFIKKYDELKSSRKMGKYFGCDKKTIIRYAKEIGYDYTPKPFINNDQVKEIESLYGIRSGKQLAQKYGVSIPRIHQIWMKAGLKGHRSYVYNFDQHNYFETIDSHDKAYFLGFLAADGCVYKRKNKQEAQAFIKLTLQLEDRDILETFKKYLHLEKPLAINKKKPSASLQIISNKMGNDLEKYNIVPAKTYAYEMIELPQQMMGHFFRGYFDGDGSIAIYDNRSDIPSSYVVSISGFKHNLQKMSSYLKNKGIYLSFLEDKRNHKYRSNLQFGDIRSSNIEQTYRFLKYIYEDCGDTFLSRKKEKADAFFKLMEQKGIKYEI